MCSAKDAFHFAVKSMLSGSQNQRMIYYRCIVVSLNRNLLHHLYEKLKLEVDEELLAEEKHQ
jgi:hypothetical protein